MGQPTDKKEKKTKVVANSFNNKPMFSIFEVDEEDKPVDERPLFSCGMTKAKLIQKHLPELEQYVTTN